MKKLILRERYELLAMTLTKIQDSSKDTKVLSNIFICIFKLLFIFHSLTYSTSREKMLQNNIVHRYFWDFKVVLYLVFIYFLFMFSFVYMYL